MNRLNACEEIKALLEDDHFISSIIIPNFPLVMTMIKKNIFRPLPNFKRNSLEQQDTGQELINDVEPGWPFLKGIYEILLEIIQKE